MQSESKLKAGTNSFQRPLNKHFVSFSVAIMAALLALLASFGLSTWAELTPFNHGIQHVVLFTAGVGFGGSLVTFFKRSKD